jgi:hypothetical protein
MGSSFMPVNGAWCALRIERWRGSKANCGSSIHQAMERHFLNLSRCAILIRSNHWMQWISEAADHFGERMLTADLEVSQLFDDDGELPQAFCARLRRLRVACKITSTTTSRVRR